MQVLVGGGYNPDIGGTVTACTHRAETVLLDGTQQHLLCFQREVAYLVKEQRAAVGFPEIPVLVGNGSRKRALHMPEQVRLGLFGGECAAVHRNERLVFHPAVIMYHPGKMLLARAVFTQYQHAYTCRGYHTDALLDALEGRSFPFEDRCPDIFLPFLLLEQGAYERQKLVLHQYLGQVIRRSELHALHRRMHFGVIGHDNERLSHARIPHLAQQSDTLAVGQAQVGKDYVVFLTACQ